MAITSESMYSVSNTTLALDDLLDGAQLVAFDGGLLKAHLGGERFHLDLQAAGDLVGAAVEERTQICDHLAVFFIVHLTDAGSVAQLDIVIQAGPRILPGDLPVTGQVGENLAQHIQGLMHRPHAGIGPKVSGAVAGHPAGDGTLG